MLGLGLGITRGNERKVLFSLSFTGMATPDSLGPYLEVGTHSQFSVVARNRGGQIVTPDSIIWSAENPSGADKSGAVATYGTGSSPTDVAGAEFVWCHVLALGVWVSRRIDVRIAPGFPEEPGSRQFTVGVPVSFFVAPFGNGLTFSDLFAAPLAPGLSFNATTGEIGGTPSEEATGVTLFGARDSEGRTKEYNNFFIWQTTLPLVGNLPVPEPQSFIGGQAWTYQHPAATGAGLTWTYAASGLPSGVTYTPATRTFAGANTLPQQIGTQIPYTATDQFGRPAEGSPRQFIFSITEIQSTEVARSITSNLPIYTLDLSTVGPAESGLATYTGQSLPGWASVSGSILTTDGRAGTVTVRRNDNNPDRDIIITFTTVDPTLDLATGNALVTIGPDDPPGTAYTIPITSGIYSGETVAWNQGNLSATNGFPGVVSRVVITAGEGTGVNAGRVTVGGTVSVDRPALFAYLQGGTRVLPTGQWHDNGLPIAGATGASFVVPVGTTGPLTYRAGAGGSVAVSNAVEIVSQATSLAVIGNLPERLRIDYEGNLTITGLPGRLRVEVDALPVVDIFGVTPGTKTLTDGTTRNVPALSITAGQLNPAPGATMTATSNLVTGDSWSLIGPGGSVVASGIVGTNALSYTIPGGTAVGTIYQWRGAPPRGNAFALSEEVVVTAAPVWGWMQGSFGTYADYVNGATIIEVTQEAENRVLIFFTHNSQNRYPDSYTFGGTVYTVPAQQTQTVQRGWQLWAIPIPAGTQGAVTVQRAAAMMTQTRIWHGFLPSAQIETAVRVEGTTNANTTLNASQTVANGSVLLAAILSEGGIGVENRTLVMSGSTQSNTLFSAGGQMSRFAVLDGTTAGTLSITSGGSGETVALARALISIEITQGV